ncbi:MAG: endolytic transglycosylase MltG, partial [Pseudomonadota bacterium]
MRHMAANMMTVLIVIGVSVVGFVTYAKQKFSEPGPLAEPTLIALPKGANLGDTSELLSKSGAISSEVLFRLGTRYSGQERDIKFGEYRVPAAASMDEILALIVSGRTEQYKVTVPEGLTSHEIVALLGTQDLLTGEIGSVPPEGTLAPDTHFVSRGQAREDVLKLLLSAQDKILSTAWDTRQEDLPIGSPAEMLVLASIVQSEAGAGELDKVASVFVNRLRRGQKLEADATVRYGLTLGKEKLGRGLRQSELRKKTPYNTYQIPGLPPTPISNPGRAAIEAVANPAQTDFLFFVADGSGGHAFARTLAEHRVNVAK